MGAPKRSVPIVNHAKDPYDAILASFKKKAEAFHQKKYRQSAQAGDETAEQRAERLEDKRSEFNHLKEEAALAKSMASVQVKLMNYRAKYCTQSYMSSEPHHPTDNLEEFLKADGCPKPSPKHSAHHIVPGEGKTQNAANARIEMHLHCIRINDPDNGVWMVRLKKDKGHWSMPNASSHLEIHTHNYEFWVYQKIRRALDEEDARRILRNIANILQAGIGEQPLKIAMPPDNEWSGNE